MPYISEQSDLLQRAIPFEYTKELDEIPELLLTVDCQYGERNVQKFDGKTVAIIDHHIAIPRSMIKRASDEETDDNGELIQVLSPAGSNTNCLGFSAVCVDNDSLILPLSFYRSRC